MNQIMHAIDDSGFIQNYVLQLSLNYSKAVSHGGKSAQTFQTIFQIISGSKNSKYFWAKKKN